MISRRRGNKYRLIAAVHYQKRDRNGLVVEGRVYVRDVLTHRDYDKGAWKHDCDCSESPTSGGGIVNVEFRGQSSGDTIPILSSDRSSGDTIPILSSGVPGTPYRS
jgi:HigB_toxin, RelE-like toxic component of a toxin-antitoxin system